MKKIFFTAALVLGAMTANAEDVLQVVPFQTNANFTNEEFDTTFSISLTNDNALANVILFDLYLPNGLDLETSWDDENTLYAMEIPKDRTKYKSGPKESNTGHVVSYNKKESDKTGYNKYTVLINQGTLLTPFQGTKGIIANAYYTVGDMPDGVYPIYIEHIEITNVATETKVDVPSTTSYVVIGNPTKASLTMEGVIPSFVNEKLATETAITNLDLSAVTKVNGTFTYVDGRAVTAPADQNVKAEHVAYTRTVGDGKYGSFKAPFAVSGCSNFYKFKNLEANYVNFTETNDIVAGDDLLATGVIDLSADDVALTNVPAPHTVDDVYFFYSEDGKFYHGDNITINPFRTFWTIGSAHSNLMMAIDGELTGIELNTIDGQNNPSYDLQGRRNENARHGIFVTNGKKQIVK